MDAKRYDQIKKSCEKPDEPAHKNLKRRAGAALVSGCLVLSLCPALAMAEVSDTSRAFDASAAPTAERAFDGFDSLRDRTMPPAYGQQDAQQGEGAMQPPMQWDGQQAPENEGERPADQPQQGGQEGRFGEPGQQGQLDQPGQPGQAGQPDAQQPGQNGQPDAQGQPGQVPSNGADRPMAFERMFGGNGAMRQVNPPEPMRNLVERIVAILDVDNSDSFVNKVMEKLGFGMMGQPGQQGQPGQNSQQPEQMNEHDASVENDA